MSITKVNADVLDLTDDYAISGSLASAGSGRVIEVLAMLCDGGSVTVGSGTYSSVAATSEQTLSTTFADVIGSNITYTPPSGAKAVIYEYEFLMGHQDASALMHQKLFLAGTEVVHARADHSNQGGTPDNLVHISWIFKIGDGNDTNTGKVATWTSGKEIKIQARNYSTSFETGLNMSAYFDGTTEDNLRIPTLKITAIS